MSYPLPLDKMRAFAAGVDQVLVVEETEALVETELRAAGIPCAGKDVLPRTGELSPDRLRPAVAHLRGEKIEARVDTGVTLVTPDNLDSEASKALLNPPLAEYLK